MWEERPSADMVENSLYMPRMRDIDDKIACERFNIMSEAFSCIVVSDEHAETKHRCMSIVYIWKEV